MTGLTESGSPMEGCGVLIIGGGLAGIESRWRKRTAIPDFISANLCDPPTSRFLSGLALPTRYAVSTWSSAGRNSSHPGMKT